MGERQRIEPLAVDEITDEAKHMLRDLAQAMGRGDERPGVPPAIATMLRHPGLYRRQVELGIQLFGSGAISPRERELVALRVAWLCRAPCEWGEHVGNAKRVGVTAEEIANLGMRPISELRVADRRANGEWFPQAAATCMRSVATPGSGRTSSAQGLAEAVGCNEPGTSESGRERNWLRGAASSGT